MNGQRLGRSIEDWCQAEHEDEAENVHKENVFEVLQDAFGQELVLLYRSLLASQEQTVIKPECEQEENSRDRVQDWHATGVKECDS